MDKEFQGVGVKMLDEYIIWFSLNQVLTSIYNMVLPEQ